MNKFSSICCCTVSPIKDDICVSMPRMILNSGRGQTRPEERLPRQLSHSSLTEMAAYQVKPFSRKTRKKNAFFLSSLILGRLIAEVNTKFMVRQKCKKPLYFTKITFAIT